MKINVFLDADNKSWSHFLIIRFFFCSLQIGICDPQIKSQNYSVDSSLHNFHATNRAENWKYLENDVDKYFVHFNYKLFNVYQCRWIHETRIFIGETIFRWVNFVLDASLNWFLSCYEMAFWFFRCRYEPSVLGFYRLDIGYVQLYSTDARYSVSKWCDMEFRGKFDIESIFFLSFKVSNN